MSDYSKEELTERQRRLAENNIITSYPELEEDIPDEYVPVLAEVSDDIDVEGKKDVKKSVNWNLVGALIALVSLFLSLIYWYFPNPTDFKTSEYIYAATLSDEKVDKENIEEVTCWSNSLSVDRRDSFRCSKDHIIYDPCFPVSFDFSLLSCPSYPEDKSTIFKYVKSEEFKSYYDDVVKSEKPWFIVLKGGDRCGFVTGATSLIANMRVDYYCDDGKILLLPIKREDDKMTIGCLSGDKVEECVVKEAWF